MFEICLSFVFSNESNIFTCCMKNDLILNYFEMNHNACCSFEALIIQEEPAPFIQAQINQTSSLWNTAHFFHQVTVHVGGWRWKQRWRDWLVHVFLCAWTSKAHGSGLQSLGLSSLLSNAFPVCWPAQSHSREAI